MKDLKPKKESKRTEENFEVLEIVDISGATVRSSKKNVAFKESALFQASKEIRNANDFLDVVDEYRRFTYGNEEAKRLTNEAVAYARRRKQYKRLDCSLIDEINDAVLKSYNRMQATPNDEEAVKEFSRLNEQRKRLVARRDTLKNELAIEAERWRSRRQEIEAFWNLLFPAQNENLFFEQPVIDDWRSIFRAEGEKRGQAQEFEEIAKEVLGVYNKIRSAFANLTTPEVPFLLFADLLDSRGAYLDDIGAIMISDRLTGNQLRATFAYEIGHWLELRCWGYEAATKNTKWLETTLKEDISVKSFKKYVDLDEKEAPTTLWRIDGYSARVYAELEIPGSSTQKYQPSEVISTAFEGLLDDPEAFARAAPEHFNLLLKLLKGETSQ
ncbi:MAG: hypothetical protein J6K20_01380 [Thermoguttaceae bacterium]|nr:hypothetical protein [Thermoguttaceae bacterium]